MKKKKSLNAEQMKKAAANFKKLPKFCYVHNPSDNGPVRVFRGEDGYHLPLYPDVWVEEVNGLLGVTVEQEQAMLSGSMFGWHTPAADPDTWKNNEKWQAKQRQNAA